MRKLKYPLLVSDFDGTLVRNDGTISANNKRAIKEYVAAGGIFALSTGRMPQGILPRVEELGLQGIVCCCQGTIILDGKTKEVIFENRLSYETTLAGCKALESLNLHIQAYDMWEYYSNADDEPLRHYQKATNTKARLINEQMSAWIERENFRSYKLLAMVEEERMSEVREAIANMRLPDCEITQSAAFLLEIVNANYSKGTAVEWLAKHYGVPMDGTIAIGDQWNDMPMIEKAGLGIAVKNADEQLKAKADFVSEFTNDEDAVARIIEKFGFLQGEEKWTDR